jgi:Uma2 family endonuclease
MVQAIKQAQQEKRPGRSHNGGTANRLPPLENGDRLTRSEFERRYWAMPEVKKAELIEGVVYMPSLLLVTHGRPHSYILTWLGVYCAATPGVDPYDNTSVRLDADNEVQPDALLRLVNPEIGASTIAKDHFIEGSPELIVEIAGSSAAYDLHTKLNVYRRNGVQEYVVWQVYDNELNWFQLVEGVYEPMAADEQGIIKSLVFPGLYLDVEALLKGDLAQVLAVLEMGLASAEHQSFVTSLDS